jgi:hypothetical protein
MKEQILAILKGGINPVGDLSKVHIYNNTFEDMRTDEMKATEIEAHIKEFIEWKDLFTKFDLENMIYTVMIETHIIEEMTLDGVYNYWLNNVKK